jgi:hypothetical protein
MFLKGKIQQKCFLPNDTSLPHKETMMGGNE